MYVSLSMSIYIYIYMYICSCLPGEAKPGGASFIIMKTNITMLPMYKML